MTNYLDILLEEQIWEDEEERTSLQLPPEWGAVWRKRRAGPAKEQEKRAAETETPNVWTEKAEPTVRGGLPGDGERRSAHAAAEKGLQKRTATWGEELLKGEAQPDESLWESIRRGRISALSPWPQSRYGTAGGAVERGLYPRMKMGQAAVAYARQRGNPGGTRLSQIEPEEGTAALPVGALDRLVERDARRYDGTHPLY